MNFALLIALFLPLASMANVSEQRCGWIESLSPAQITLEDQDGSWLIAKAGHQAKGQELLPELNLTSPTGGSAACGCLDVVVNNDQNAIERIVGAYALPLSECQNDSLLPKRSWEESTRPAPRPKPSPSPAPVPGEPWPDPDFPEPIPGQPPEKGPIAPETEIQVFVDYRGYDDYAVKYVSTLSQVVSAGILYPSTYNRNAACFMGNANEALRVFEAMVDEMNFLEGRQVQLYGRVYFDAADTQKDVLAIDAIDESGQEFSWFKRIRECDRWATPEEKSNRP